MYSKNYSGLKKKLCKHKPPSSKVPAGTSVTHKCSFLFMFLTPTCIYVCSWNPSPLSLKNSLSNKQLRMGLRSISAGQHSAQQCGYGQHCRQKAARRMHGPESSPPAFPSNLLVWCSIPLRLNFLLLQMPPNLMNQQFLKPYALQAVNKSPTEWRVSWWRCGESKPLKTFYFQSFPC